MSMQGTYTGKAMDRVRFGRALGYGARHAAKSLLQMVDAASAPGASGAAKEDRGGARGNAPPRRVVASATEESVRQAPRRVAATGRIVPAGKQARALGRSVWSPLARFSSVLWLQVTGTFFALIAAFLSKGLWDERGVVRLGVHAGIHSAAAERFYLQAAAFAAFTYFAVSSFVRARRRERR